MHSVVTRPHSRTGTSRCGFTLAEVVVVMVLTTIVAAAAIPSVLSLLSTRGKVAARQVARDLTFARQRAIATSRTIWVVFNPSLDEYTMLEEPAGSGGRSAATALIDPATGVAFRQRFNRNEFGAIDMTAAGISGGSEVGFDWRGRPKVNDATFLSSTATITLTGATVSIEPETGLSQWQ